MSRLAKTSLLLAVCFGIDKVLAVVRQVLIARQFGLSPQLDAFNAANNIPDMLFALISGGALAMALIPVLSATAAEGDRRQAWLLFSRIANLAFLVTAGVAALVALFADPLVRSQIGVAPGFTPEQQGTVVNLMRLNLIATTIFSVSGLVIAGLQAQRHFLLPALAPIFYNLGQIFGVLVLAPSQGYHLGPLTLPAFGLGVYGLVYGVILGALLHLLIQLPGLPLTGFAWQPRLDLKSPQVRKVLSLLAPRVGSVFLIQLTFIMRDNFASRLPSGSVTALTYGYMIQQVPETLIGTAIGTALLPTLSTYFANHDMEAFRESIQRAIYILIAITLPVAAVLSLSIGPFLQVVFGFDTGQTGLVQLAAQAFLIGLLGQSLLEVGSRSFYAQQDALVPLAASAITPVLYLIFGSLLYRPLGVFGIGLTDSLAFTVEALLLLFLLHRRFSWPVALAAPVGRGLAAMALSGALCWGLIHFPGQTGSLRASASAIVLGALVSIPLVWPQLRSLRRL